MQVRIRIPNRRKSAGSDRAAPEQTAAAVATAQTERAAARRTGGGSSRVAAGILVSRISGLIRERVIGHYFGVDSVVADAFRAAIRIPNLLANLFGEGVLSASFVTVYAKLRARQQDEDADDLAAGVFGILALLCSVLVTLGVVSTPYLIDFIAPGFHGYKRDLTIHIVRILFPGTGLLVMSAWCLGVLNSHRRFLLSYAAPVALNAAIIAVSIYFGRHVPEDPLVLYVAWGYVAGSVLQFLVQLPSVLRLLPHFRPALDWHSEHVRTVMQNFGPIFVSRGVVQISSYIDQMIASNLPTGAVAALGYGQVISILPVSLFSMSISAAELPALSSAIGNEEEVAATLRSRLTAGLRRIAFFIIPSAVAFLALGDVLVAALYQTGRFQHAGSVYVWSVIAGSAIGLLATSLGRLYSSGFYALLDTRTPLRFAIIRVALTTALGLMFAFWVPRWLGIEQRWGVAGLTASAGIAGWVEFTLLRHALGRRIGRTPLPVAFTLKLWSAAVLAAALGYWLKTVVETAHPVVVAAVVLPAYGIVYFAVAAYAGIPESKNTLSAVFRGLRLKL
ncbi:MAG: murein biosynthesis integral membrane protein MurJ [Acidobacteriaceae bacterium]|nr:murein biosynthesis integral membrane protein MurJ [Acidobacteriaceae bacterium]